MEQQQMNKEQSQSPQINQSQSLLQSQSQSQSSINNLSLKLNSTWNFWYASRKEQDHHIPYSERLVNIGEFSTLEDFFMYYLYIKPVIDLERNNEISMFKRGYQPIWESCPNSGCWFLRFRRTDDLNDIDLKWEKIILALIAEQFDEPNMLGAILSIRGRETIIEIWFNYFKYEKIKSAVAEKFHRYLKLDDSHMIYFKDNGESLVDKSTLRNAEMYSLKSKRKMTYK